MWQNVGFGRWLPERYSSKRRVDNLDEQRAKNRCRDLRFVSSLLRGGRNSVLARLGLTGSMRLYAAWGGSSLSNRLRLLSMETRTGWLCGVPHPSRRTSERADPLALLPLSMQTTFNLYSCIYVHLLMGCDAERGSLHFERIVKAEIY